MIDWWWWWRRPSTNRRSTEQHNSCCSSKSSLWRQSASSPASLAAAWQSILTAMTLRKALTTSVPTYLKGQLAEPIITRHTFCCATTTTTTTSMNVPRLTTDFDTLSFSYVARLHLSSEKFAFRHFDAYNSESDFRRHLQTFLLNICLYTPIFVLIVTIPDVSYQVYKDFQLLLKRV